MKTTHLFYLILLSLLFDLSSVKGNTADHKREFIVGIWCTKFIDYVYRGHDTWHIQQEEKQRILDLGLNYLIACTDNAQVEEAIINFCEEVNGAIKATLERRPSDSFQMWRYSHSFGTVGNTRWERAVQNGYAEIGNKFGSSIGLHSVLIGAEIRIQAGRWNEVEFMAQTVNDNIPENPVSVTQEYWNPRLSPNFVANIPGSDIYMTLQYSFRADPRTPYSGPGFQNAVDKMAEAYSGIMKTIRDNNLSTDFYAILQTQESLPEHYNYRLPTKEEILLNVNLALAYGAKGIVYYLYAPTSTETGLLDHNRNPTDTYRDVREINRDYLNVHGNHFMVLTWLDGYGVHSHNRQPDGIDENLYSVRSRIPEGPYDSGSETYVEIGYFKDSDDDDYYMVVNRRALSTETRIIELVFRTDQYRALTVKDVYSGEKTTFSHGDMEEDGRFIFRTIIEPGQGKLLQLKTDGL